LWLPPIALPAARAFPTREAILATRDPTIFSITCPYHDDHYWQELQNRSPDEFDEACQFDETIRHLPGVKGECFLHSSCIPLRDIDFSRTRGERRALSRGQTLLFDGGEGVCSL
jgi:hypothetical protein